MLFRRRSLRCLVTILVIAVVFVGCEYKETGEALVWPTLSLMLSPSFQPTVELTVAAPIQLTATPKGRPAVKPTVTPTPTPSILGPSYDPDIDLWAGPVDLPLELRIPSLKVNAPLVAVGLTSENVMDAPKGPIGDPLWHTAFWYRGGGIPGEPGTATIAGHVSNMEGKPEIFARLEYLHPGDVIIIHVKDTLVDIRYIVDQVKVYTFQESSDLSVLTQIYGAGPIAGTGPQLALDGHSHLTLITCAGNFFHGHFDRHMVVYATHTEPEQVTP
jgi:hypothetical protein